MTYFALDYGADSGRTMVGQISDRRIMLEEIHHFNNRQVRLGNAMNCPVNFVGE